MGVVRFLVNWELFSDCEWVSRFLTEPFPTEVIPRWPSCGLLTWCIRERLGRAVELRKPWSSNSLSFFIHVESSVGWWGWSLLGFLCLGLCQPLGSVSQLGKSEHGGGTPLLESPARSDTYLLPRSHGPGPAGVGGGAGKGSSLHSGGSSTLDAGAPPSSGLACRAQHAHQLTAVSQPRICGWAQPAQGVLGLLRYLSFCIVICL